MQRLGMRGVRRGLSTAKLTQEEIVRSCKEHTMWSWSAQKAVDPIVMTRSENIYFWDANGKKYTDVNSQLMCSNIGHQHPKVIQAIKDQADKLCYAGPSMATEIRAEFGPLLAARTPGNLNKFFFTLGGSEANENAIKLARLHTGRNKIIARYKSYHGGTHGSMMLTGDPRRWANETGGGMSGVIRAFDPYMYRSLLYRPGMSEEEFSAIILRQLEEQIIYENPNRCVAALLARSVGSLARSLARLCVVLTLSLFPLSPLSPLSPPTPRTPHAHLTPPLASPPCSSRR